MMSETIRIIMIKRNMTGKDLADALGCSTQNVYARLKKDNWSEEQLQKIAERLNCKLNITFTLNDTGETF